MLLLVAAGSADELPGLLDWLEWGAIALGPDRCRRRTGECRPRVPPHWPRDAAQGAAVWLRPPEPGHEVEPTLPALAPFGRDSGHGDGGAGAPDLVRLVDTAATECHRARLLRAKCAVVRMTQPLAFS